MRRSLPALLIALVAVPLLIFAQGKSEAPPAQPKHEQMSGTAKDSDAMHSAMEQIATNRELRMQMLRMIMQHAKGDSAAMAEIHHVMMTEPNRGPAGMGASKSAAAKPGGTTKPAATKPATTAPAPAKPMPMAPDTSKSKGTENTQSPQTGGK